MSTTIVDTFRDFFQALWDGLGTLIVPGTESLSWRTVLVAPFGFAVFSFALNKVLNMSAHQGVSDIARNTYKKYEKDGFDH